MSFNKKDLEIIYSLSWKNGPKREDKETSIVAVYDIPSTTLNFEMFKSYLLKNSGIPERDVRVAFIMDNGKEYPIQSQTDFQVALYAFRRKARSGEIIHLLLERISDRPIHNMRHSNDVETQFDNVESSSIAFTKCCNIETAPEWFVSSLAQLKKEITEEISVTISSVVSTALANVKLQPINQIPCHHHSRRSKPEKRIRKITPHLVENPNDAKNLIKSMKLDHKLEKLERKASKYREKRQALQTTVKSSDSDAGQSSSRGRSHDKNKKCEGKEPKMDAKPINVQTSIPHMLGGEIYLHQWEVQNTGDAPWTMETYLQYTWGSKSLKPARKIAAVPHLKPGEKGEISVRLHIPTESGKYECYWQFMHNARRFGHWLGCQVIVDPFDLKGNSSVLETSTVEIDNFCENLKKSEEVTNAIPKESLALKNFEDILSGPFVDIPRKSTDAAKSAEALASLYKSLQNDKSADHSEAVKNITEQLVREVSNNAENINFDENDDSDSNSSDDENLSLLDGYASSKNSIKDEFVMVPVPMPQCYLIDHYEKLLLQGSKSDLKLNGEQPSTSGVKTTGSEDSQKAKNNFDDNNNENASGATGNSIKLHDEDLDNVVVITVPKDDHVKEGYIYIHVDGQKVLIPKNILKSEVVNAAHALEKQPGDKNSIGVAIGSSEDINKTPTPSSVSTLPYQQQQANDDSGNTIDAASVATEQKTHEDVKNISIEMPSLKVNCGSQNDLESDYFDQNNYMSHCSAAGSCFSEVNNQSQKQNRLFIFPQNVPGYEVVYPVLDANIPDNSVLSCDKSNGSSGHQAQPNIASEALPGENSNPFNNLEHIPNFQQTPPDQRAPSLSTTQNLPNQEVFFEQQVNHDEDVGVNVRAGQEAAGTTADSTQVHILPETLVNGAVNVASSAFNTAKSVINMIKPQSPGRWVNGHWVSTNPQTPREANLQALAEMGFWNRDLNATLLARYNDDLNRVVAELVQ